MSQLCRQAEREFSLPLPFYSIQAFNRLDEAHPLWEESPALLSPPIQMLIFSKKALSEMMLDQLATWAPPGAIKLTDP